MRQISNNVSDYEARPLAGHFDPGGWPGFRTCFLGQKGRFIPQKYDIHMYWSIAICSAFSITKHGTWALRQRKYFPSGNTCRYCYVGIDQLPDEKTIDSWWFTAGLIPLIAGNGFGWNLTRKWRGWWLIMIFPSKSHHWLVVWTPLKNISQLGWWFPIYGKIKNGNQTTNQIITAAIPFFLDKPLTGRWIPLIFRRSRCFTAARDARMWIAGSTKEIFSSVLRIRRSLCRCRLYHCGYMYVYISHTFAWECLYL